MIKYYLSLIKFSHTIFALPFALVGFTLGIQEGFAYNWQKILFLVLICMVTARSAAMAFNRYLDRDIDAKNPRTVIREIPSGILKAEQVRSFVIFMSLLFIMSAYFINTLCFFLSPVALAVILGYSYTKRFTYLCHLVLGLGLGLAPVGAYLAVTNSFSWPIVMLGIAVMTWVAGFDIIYALQDESFDKNNNLNSIPAQFGGKQALMISRLLHTVSGLALGLSFYLLRQQHGNLGFLAFLGYLIFVGMLVYQHSLVSHKDLSKINLAFFTTNGIASIVIGSCFVLDLLV